MFANVASFYNYMRDLSIKYSLDNEYLEEVLEHTQLYSFFVQKNVNDYVLSREIGLTYAELNDYILYACYMISHKYHNDICYGNHLLNSIFNLNLKKLNLVEMHCLKAMQYKLQRKYYVDYSFYTIHHVEMVEQNDNFEELDKEFHYSIEIESVLEKIIEEKEEEYDSDIEHLVIDMTNLVIC